MHFIDLALQEAELGAAEGGIPTIGAVLVHNVYRESVPRTCHKTRLS